MPLAVPEKKALLLNLTNPQAVKDVIPAYQEVDGFIAVPHTPAVFNVLKNMGLKVTGHEPMRARYHWPKLSGRWAPMKHQIETAVFATQNDRCYILNDMRTGKSASCIWAIDFLRQIGQCKGVLILSTMTCMETVWKNEIWSVTPKASVAIVHGSRAKREMLLDKPYNYYVINHDGIKVVQPAIRKAIEEGRIDTIIMDEGSEFRHPDTNRFATMVGLASPSLIKRIWWLTATPCPNGPEDAWAQCRIVNPSRVPKYKTHWKDKTMRQLSTYKWLPRDGWREMVFEAMQPAIRFAKKDVLELPPVMFMDRPVALTRTQALDMAKVKKEGAILAESGPISAVNAAVLLGKMMQIAAGAVKTDAGQIHTYEIADRLRALTDTMAESKSKTIVFANNHAVLDLIADHLTKKGFRVAQVDGRVTGNKRTERISGFQTMDRYDVVVAHPKPAGHGLELSAADQVIWFAPTHSVDLYTQANNRIMSGKQVHAMGVYHIYAAAFEKVVYNHLREGVDAQDKVLELYKLATSGEI